MRLLWFRGHIFQVIQRCPSHTNREDGDTYNGSIFKWIKTKLQLHKIQHELLSHVWLFATPWTRPPGSSVHGDSPSKNPGVGCHAFLQGIFPNPEIEPRSPALQADFLPSEWPGEPMNTGMGSLSLLQGIFLTQELNQSLLHCRWILFQLSYQAPKTYCRKF